MNPFGHEVLLGLPDSGINSSLSKHILDEQGFGLDDKGDILRLPVNDNNAKHGTALANIILATANNTRLLNAQVFHHRKPSSPVAIAASLLWLLKSEAQIINMSFGLRNDRTVLRQACLSAQAQGVILVAATPAQGDIVYPAAYPGIIRVTGDARCAPGEMALLNDERIDFGACPGPIDHVPHQAGGGASLAVAHVSGALANFLLNGGSPDEAIAYLRTQCTYSGREQRA